MKKLLSVLFIGIAMIWSVGTVEAATITVDSSVGWAGTLGWSGGVGAQLGTGWAPVDPSTFEMTVAADSTIDLVAADDCCIIGDAFDFYVDGSLVALTSSFGGSGGILWSGTWQDVFLSAGTHSMYWLVSADCCGSGGASFSISSVTAAAAPVPEPGTMLLLGSGMIGLVCYRRKRA